MKRYHSQGDQCAITRHKKDWLISCSSVFLEDGRMRKKHPFDCGNPQCFACSKQPQKFNRNKKGFRGILEEKKEL